jgi:hypothetical protein
MSGPAPATPAQQAATATTTHGEKITHAVNALNNAGLSDGGRSGGLGDKKWIIVGAVAGGIALLILILLLCVFLRARRKRRQRAYAAMNGSRGIDMKDNSNEKSAFGNNRVGAPTPQTGMRGFLMPSWRSAKGKGKEHQNIPSVDVDLSSRRSSFDPAAPQQTYENRGRGLSVDHSRARSRDASRHSRSRSRGPNMGPLGEEMFNADKEMMPSESDSMLVQPKLGERNFESGYSAMDTEYRSSVMGGEVIGGDKRSGF